MRIKIFPLGLSNEHRIPVNTDVTAAAAASPARFSRRQKEFSIRVSKGPHLCELELKFFLQSRKGPLLDGLNQNFKELVSSEVRVLHPQHDLIIKDTGLLRTLDSLTFLLTSSSVISCSEDSFSKKTRLLSSFPKLFCRFFWIPCLL